MGCRSLPSDVSIVFCPLILLHRRESFQPSIFREAEGLSPLNEMVLSGLDLLRLGASYNNISGQSHD
jgi:hypothetical protein